VNRVPEPAYLDIAGEVAHDLGGRAPGSAAPSEHELAARFGVSRLTARAALEELERRWLVRRRQGRGTFVARRIEYRVGLDVPPSWTEVMRQTGAEPSSVTEWVRKGEGPAWVRRELGLDVNDRVLHLRRVHTLDGELASCSDTWVVEALTPGLAKELGKTGSLYLALAGRYRLEPVRAWYRAELDLAPPRVAARLGVSAPPLTLATRGRVDSVTAGRPLEVTCAWARADLLRVVFEVGGR
jgi:GntR family transcriptional regulator